MLAQRGRALDDRAALFLASRIFAALAAAHGARDPETRRVRAGHPPRREPVEHPRPVGRPREARRLRHREGRRARERHADRLHQGHVRLHGARAGARRAAHVRADVYAASLLLWELLARRKAVQRGSCPTRTCSRPWPSPTSRALDLLRPDIDAGVRDAVRRALEPNADKRGITADDMVNVLRQVIPGDEGRVALTQALTRVKPAGAGDPLASTQTRVAADPRIERGAAPTAERVDRVDPEQTAPFAALSDEGSDLGKIAFYGRIKLPNEEPTVVRASSPPAEAVPPRPPSAPGSKPALKPGSSPGSSPSSPARFLPRPRRSPSSLSPRSARSPLG